MVKVINSTNGTELLPFASDVECEAYRNAMVNSGVITPCDPSEIITKRDDVQVLSTRETSKAHRNRLIERGIIQPRPSYEDIPKMPRGPRNLEEGEYFSKKITSEGEYQRRRDVYLWLISDILHARKDLRLAFDRKNKDDPDWYF